MSDHNQKIRARDEIEPLAPSAACVEVARMFGVDPNRLRTAAPRAGSDVLYRITPRPGTITLVTGPSGAGKSSLLRQLRRRLRKTHRVIEIGRIHLPARPMVDCFAGLKVDAILQCLSRVGLAEVACYVRKPSKLSLGQRWRLRLAMAMHLAETPGPHEKTILVCDEFAALLDRVTACVVARSLRRCIGASTDISAIVATSHDELIRALQPDSVAHCDFGAVQTYHREVRP